MKKIDIKFTNQKSTNNRDNKDTFKLTGQIKQKVLNPNFNNLYNSNSNSNSLKSLNYNNNLKGVLYRNISNNNSYKTYRAMGKDDYKTSERFQKVVKV